MERKNLPLKLFFLSLFSIPFLVFSQVNGISNSTKSEALNVPFYEDFNTEDQFNEWRVEDVNVDTKTWKYFPANGVGSSGCAGYAYTSRVADDWLFSPGINLKPGILYRLTYKIKVGSSTYASENLKVTLSTSTEPDSEKKELAKHEAYKNTSWKTYTVDIEVDEESVYYLGFYMYSPASKDRLYLDDVSLELLYVKSAPKSIAELDIIPAALGQLSAEIKFKAPSQANDGTNLSEISVVNIYRNKSVELAGVISSPTPGAELSWIDNSPENGFNTYTIIPVNSSGEGVAVSDSAYIGIDIPLDAKNMKAVKNGNNFVLTWEAPDAVGANGGYVDASQVKYFIGANGQAIDVVEGETTYTNKIELPENVQGYFQFQLQPYNIAGMGTQTASNLLNFGTPYPVPYAESFANAKITKPQWGVDSRIVVGSDAPQWTFTSAMGYPYYANPQDDDNGFVYFNSERCRAGSSLTFLSPSVSIKGLTNPKLTFYVFHLNISGSNDKDILQIQVSADDADYEDLAGGLIKLNATNDGWTLYEMPLTDYVGKEKITIGFKGISGYGYNLAIDNITIENEYASNLEIGSLIGPKYITAGDSAVYTVSVKNTAKTTVNATDYKLMLYKDGAEYLTADGIDLQYKESATIDFKVVTDIEDSDKSCNIYAQIVYSLDENEADNKTEEYIVNIQKPGFPMVEDLTGAINGTLVNLSWTEPEYPKTSQEKSDDFESYTPFIIDNIGDWTVVDADAGAQTYAPQIVDPGAYPNAFSAMAFQVYNPKMAHEGVGQSASYAPHSGNQYLIAWGSIPYDPVDNPGGVSPNDDWLISPELSGYGETLSFYAKAVVDAYGKEQFQVLYSTTDNDINSFIKLNLGEYEEVSATWTEFTYQIPAKAKYFAIRYISNDVYGLMIDDIKYISEPLTLIGYNIYRDGVKLTETPISETSFSDNILSRSMHIYTISVVYDKGESYYSNEYIVQTPTGVDEELSSAINVYGGNGSITINGALGLNASIISLDGRIVSNVDIAQESMYLSIESGIYFVKIENRTFKVIVK